MNLSDAAAERLHDFSTSHPMTMTYGSWLDLKADLRALLSERAALREALKLLHDNTAEYIRLNHLGDPHHNQDMRMARAALADDAQ